MGLSLVFKKCGKEGETPYATVLGPTMDKLSGVRLDFCYIFVVWGFRFVFASDKGDVRRTMQLFRVFKMNITSCVGLVFR